jgi:GlpG protein
VEKIKFGELADKSAAANIVSQLAAKGIVVESVWDGHLCHLFVDNKEDIPLALDVYRVTLGLSPVFAPDKDMQKLSKVPFGVLTKLLLVICVGLYALFMFDAGKVFIEQHLFFGIPGSEPFAQIMAGEYWRLLTPALIHFSILHILFNSMWLKTLGSLIEWEDKAGYFILLIVVSALSSNFIQYIYSGPRFGGLSGVVFAFLVHVWIKKKCNPDSFFELPKRDVMLMGIWFVLCMSGMVGSIANMAHGVGLSIGMIFGAVLGTVQAKEPNWAKALGYSVAALGFSVLVGLIEVWKSGGITFYSFL